MNLANREEAAALKSSMHIVFESPQGKEVMTFIEEIGSWYPKMSDSTETNDVISRDANRRLIGTIKTILKCSPDEISALINKAEGR